MNYDNLGRAYTNTKELVELLYQNPDADISRILVDDALFYNTSHTQLHAEFCRIEQYLASDIPVQDFDSNNQSNWHMPDEYKTLDIAEWILSQCQTPVELQRVGEELLLFQDRDLFNLLRYLKYLVDTFRKNNIVWGVGRGSSVSSYVLFLIGIHKIDSIYYNLSIDEFLK